MNISLSMIVRGGSDLSDLRKSLMSTVPFADEVCVVQTCVPGEKLSMGVEGLFREICDDCGVPLKFDTWEDAEGNADEGWIHDFAEARNRSQSMVTGDVWFWIDSDTVLENGPGWRELVESAFADEEVGSMSLNYQYDFDTETGDCTTEVATHMVFRSGLTVWSGVLHEQCLFSKRMKLVDATKGPSFLKHLKVGGDHMGSTRRNKWILDKYILDGGEMSAKLWLAVCTTNLALEDNVAAMRAVKACLESDPSDDERWRALTNLASILRDMGHMQAALGTYGEMAALHPERDTPWVLIGQALCEMGDYRGALSAIGRIGAYGTVPEGNTVNRHFLKYSPMYTLARSYAALGDIEPAIDAFSELLKVKPDSTAAEEHMNALIKQRNVTRKYQAFKEVSEHLGDYIFAGAPDDMYIIPEVGRARRPERPDDRETVMIWCGPAAGAHWGPSSLGNGVGGSEEAVIYLSRELVAAGMHVEVYASPQEGDFGMDEHGVVWCHYASWEDSPGIFVQWRATHMIERATKASARYVWVHDHINNMSAFPEELRQHLDKAMCLSEFHSRPLVAAGWEDQVMITANGIPLSVTERSEAMHLEPTARRPHSFAYYSSPDRGLESLLRVWLDIREELPTATLDIYYGFTPHYKRAMAGSEYLRDLKNNVDGMVKSLKDDGVTWHGMVSHDELHESMATTEFWLYPTAFYETSCITAMKCQALGCIPVTSRFPGSALPETCKFDLGPEPRSGSIYEDSEWLTAWKDRVVEVAKMKESELPFTRKEMQTWARQHFDWSLVAKGWVSTFRAAIGSRKTGSKSGSAASPS